MRERATSALLWLYGRVASGGLLDRPRPRAAFERLYLAYKRLEAGRVSPLRELVRPGSSVVDVGANIGFFSLRFADWVGPQGRVIAVEPERRNMRSLRRRLASSGVADRVRCVEAAAADAPGELRLALNPLHPGDHRLAGEGSPVAAVTVDDLVGSGDAPPVSLLKIDVQGAEAMVIAGSRRTIERDHPAIFCELDDDALTELGASAAEIVATLAALGYEPHRLGRSGAYAASPEEVVAASRRGYIDVLFL